MKQTIEIEVPDGYKAVYNKDTQRIEVMSATLPKSWREFCDNYPIENYECLISEHSIIKDFYPSDVEIPQIERKERKVNENKNLLPNKETAEAFLALMQLIQLRDCYRQGWVPDWEDEKNKFSIEIIDGEIATYWDNRRSRILSFQSIEVRDEFWNNFKDLIEQAKELI